MAVDSHGDSQYELLIDTVNNNSKSILSSDLNEKNRCGIFPHTPISLDSSRAEGSSSRRKCCPLSKGITIEEFLEAEDSYQLTPIDRLLLKNKIALARDQMKRTRAKQSKESVSAVKKEARKNGGKVVCSKIAAKRKTTEHRVIRSHEAAKCNGDARIVSRLKNDSDSAIFRSTLKPTKKLAFTTKNGKTRPQCVNRKAKMDVKKKSSNVIRNEESDRRISLLKRRSLKKETRGNSIKKQKKPLELKRLKICLNYQTRSGNKERLRSGRPRIMKDKDCTTSSRVTKRPKNGNYTSAKVADTMAGRNSLKRVIKAEPLDDDCGIRDKRRKVERWANSSFSNKCGDGEDDKNNFSKCESKGRGNRTGDTSKVSTHSSNSARIYNLPNSKVESVLRVKQEANQFEDSKIFQINVNMSLPVIPPTTIRTNAMESIGVNVKKEYFPYIDCSAESASSSCSIQKELSTASARPEASASYIETGEIGESNSSLSSSVVFVNASAKKSVHSDSGDKENSSKYVTSVIDEGLSVLNSVPAESIDDRGFLDELKNRLHSNENSSLTKESMFNALGLQSIDKLNQKPKGKETRDKENYTGTLKAVIKIDKGCRRIEMKQQECTSVRSENIQEDILSFYSKIMQTTTESTNGCSETYVSSNNTDDATNKNWSTEPLYIKNDTDKCNDRIVQNKVPLVNSMTEAAVTETGDVVVMDVKDKNKVIEPLVVPEKSSSFSIHPDRLCSDVCKYCYGKFGSLDTPCHVAQLKNSERQKKILSSEPNLKMDTCLCDACFRFVDRKANRPPIKRKAMRRSSINQRTLCAVQNCNQIARHYGKRKWRLKIGRKIANLSFDVSRRGSRMSFGLCTHHYCEVDLQTLCGICKKRLNRNDMYSIRSEVNGLNEILKQDKIPISLVDSTLLCKQCHHCMSLRIKYGNTCNMSLNNRQYYQCFRKQILHQHNVTSDDQESYTVNAEEPGNGSVSQAEKPTVKQRIECDDSSHRVNNKNKHNVGIREIASLLKPLEAEHMNEKNSTHIQLKFGNLNIGKLSNLNIGQNTQPEVKNEKMANDEELPLIADFSFENDGTVQKNWEKCVSTIQFDQGTKKLWQDLQKPYGNQSSFIRHLIMLEKYWRSGALVLSEKAEAGAVKYINSVKNRVESLETSPTTKNLPKNCVSMMSSPEVTPPRTTNCVRVCNGSVNCADVANRHVSTPPPLLKLSSIPTSYIMRQVQIGNAKSAPEVGFQTMKSNASSRTVSLGHPLPPPPVLKRMTGGGMCVNEISVAQRRNKEMTYLQPPRSKQFVHVGGSNAPVLSMSFLNKTNQSGGCPMTTTSSTVSVNFPSKQFASPLMKTENNHQSLLIPKLPKALTVTQIEEPSVRVKQDSKPSLVLAPFLVGEKPSISVFREVAK